MKMNSKYTEKIKSLKINRLPGIMLLVSLFIITAGIVQGNDCYPINGETIEQNTNSRPFVCFDHDRHNEKAGLDECSLCHHVYEGGRLVPHASSDDTSCSECHATSNELDLAVKYHKLCRDCHLGEKKGPVVCAQCHVKNP
ncbi:MAG: cytochrome c3 family protein [Desulfamplus sp.]|nr:cytochrome c3 family protein [Desulfamplus sp.]